jgi:hypothetical protein
VLINPPDGTKWKVYWKKVNGEIWFQKGWKNFTQNYSLAHGSLVLFKYKKEGTSNFNVLILGQNAMEIDYVPSCHTYNDESIEILDEKDNVDHSDDESVMILDELSSPRPHKEVRGMYRLTQEPLYLPNVIITSLNKLMTHVAFHI